jgi:hypothetical protein
LPSWAPRLNAISISDLTTVADTVDLIVTLSLTPVTQHALRRACDIGIELGTGHAEFAGEHTPQRKRRTFSFMTEGLVMRVLRMAPLVAVCVLVTSAGALLGRVEDVMREFP